MIIFLLNVLFYSSFSNSQRGMIWWLWLMAFKWFMAYLELLAEIFPGWTEKTHEEPQSKYQVTVWESRPVKHKAVHQLVRGMLMCLVVTDGSHSSLKCILVRNKHYLTHTLEIRGLCLWWRNWHICVLDLGDRAFTNPLSRRVNHSSFSSSSSKSDQT
jgi:hypothetical protein